MDTSELHWAIGKTRELFERRHVFVGKGQSRLVFALDDSTVIKIPNPEEGLAGAQDNVFEFINWEKRKGFWSDKYAEVSHFELCYEICPVLYMERLEIICTPESYPDLLCENYKLPSWAYSQDVDSAQVGVNKNKAVVIYDYSVDNGHDYRLEMEKRGMVVDRLF